MIGKTIGHYQITSQIGKGGMGEVYHAKDQKLGRNVAIKVLPDEFARDSDRVARFQREAKVLASLNHPNIAAIHGLEESDGTKFLVLELVEGETLSERLRRGPIPVEESLKLALQIAEALEAAHEKGVIHRDLKPSNIKVTSDGKVKVLDFGLAKAYAGEQEELNLSNSPTISGAATQQGVILGTAAYMSPEQARGKAVDKKADIWAFGCVLFEMLTGQAAFSGKDVTDILAAVIRSEPEWNSLPPMLHGRLREVIERCLKKDIRDRYHDISDVRVDIQKVLTDPNGVLLQPVVTLEPRTRLRTMLPWVLAILGIVVAAIAVWYLEQTPSAEPRRVIRLDHVLPEDQQIVIPVSRLGHTLAVSPDGNQFAYSISKGIFIRSVNELNALLIPGTSENPQSPFFSPDGQWIGYWSRTDNKLKKISIRGGAPVELCSVSWVYGAIWYPDNTIVYSDVMKGIMRVSANGGTPEVLVKGPAVAPQILPDGKSLLFTDVMKQPYRITVQSLKSADRKELFAGFAAHYLPTGHLVYGLQNNNNLFAVAFDVRKLEVKGGPVPIVEGVKTSLFAVSNSGTLVYVPGVTDAAPSGSTLVWVDRDGKEEPIGAPPNEYAYPKISPDGTRVTLTVATGGNQDIWIWDLVRKTLTRLTFDKPPNLASLWTLDGKQTIFSSNQNGTLGIYRKAADGTGKTEQLVSVSGRLLFPYSLSSNGKVLVMCETGTDLARWDIGMVSMEGDHARTTLLHDEYNQTQPQVSPDGRWMAYASTESGQNQIYVRPFPEVDKGKWQVSTSVGTSPRWSPDGRELFYLSNDNSMMAVAVETKPVFSLGTPKKLFQNINEGWSPSKGGIPWDISPDGKRFLMMKEPGFTASTAGGSRKINIVVNWIEELKQRVPVK